MARQPHEPIHVTEQTFEQDVLGSDLPVVVDFWAPWCSPCRLIGPQLDRLAETYADQITVAKVNVDNDQALAQAFGVRGIPTLMVFMDGRLIDQVVGYRGTQALEELFDGLASQGEQPREQILH